ncbi:MAG: DUF5717 family protein [Candidatus Fimimorpha sp.]
MNERMNQIARGTVRGKVPQIVFSNEELKEQVLEGQVHNYEFLITSDNEIPIEGILYSSHPYVSVKQKEIKGTVVRVLIEVDASYAAAGECIEGEFCLVSNGGEYYLPYRFKVTALQDHTSEVIRELSQFTDLAKKDFSTALQVFLDKEFVRRNFMKEISYRALYYGLLGGDSEASAMEEFLIALKQKEPVHITLEQSSDSIDEVTREPGRKLLGEIKLNVSGWGYTQLTCETDMSWIQFEKKQITSSDFKGNSYSWMYKVEIAKLHPGKNDARIWIKTPYEKLEYTVHIHVPSNTSKQHGQNKKGWNDIYTLLMSYENNQMPDNVVLNALEQKATDIMKHDPDDVRLHLVRVWVYFLQKNDQMSAHVLEWVEEPITKEREKDAEAYCFMLYIKALLQGEKEAVQLAREQIHACFSREPNAFLGYLELCMNPNYAKETEAYKFVKELFEAGIHSPILYSLTCRMLAIQPQLLQRVGQFELQTLFYGARNQLLDESVKNQLLSLPAPDLKFFSIYYRLLCILYEEEENRSVLEAICGLLVRTGKTDKKYQKWYVLGMEHDISLTSLEEYYMYSLSENGQEELPERIIQSYSIKDGLDEKSKCILYTYIIQHYKRDSEIYQSYKKRMEDFVNNQIQKSNVNGRMKRLYREFLSVQSLTESQANVVPDLLFSKKITTSLPFAKRVVIRYAQLQQEVIRPISNQMAWVPVYMDTAAIIFEDEYGNRYADPSYQIKEVFEDEALLQRCFELCPNHRMISLVHARHLEDQPIEREEELYLAINLLNVTTLENMYRQMLLEAIIQYCFTHRTQEALQCENLLLELNCERLAPETQVQVVEILVESGYYPEAYERLKMSPWQQMDKEKLLYLLTRRIVDSMYRYDRWIVIIGYWLQEQGFYNEIMLSYLAKFFEGSNEQMYRLLRTVKKTNTEYRDLPGRVLEQIITTGEFQHICQVYEWYSEQEHPLEVLQRAYYVLKCHCYFCREKWDQLDLFTAQDASVLENWFCTESQSLPMIYAFALVKYYATCEYLDERQKKLAEQIVELLCRKKCWIKEMIDLDRHIFLPYELEGRGIAQIVTKEKKAAISVCHIPSGKEELLYMEEVYPGVFTKSFVLFADESLTYHIYGAEKDLIGDGRLDGTECFMSQDSRYACLNRAVMLAHNKQNEEFLEQLKEIDASDFLRKQLFPLI